MWGTFILDLYRDDERRAVADALDDLCHPEETYGFASGGIYCYWDPRTRRVLYIGRASELATRFKQHNGLTGRGSRGNKRKQIADHFAGAEQLGFSVLVRSPHSQGFTGSHGRRIADADLRSEFRAGSWQVNDEISDAEGIAIRSESMREVSLPAWNEIEGSAPSWLRTTAPDDSAALFTGTIDSLLQARRTLRELSADPTHTRFEEQLLVARMEAVRRCVFGGVQMSDEDILRAIDSTAEQQLAWGDRCYAEDVERIRESRYLLTKAAPVIGEAHPLRQAQRRAWTERQALPTGPPAPPR